MTHFTLQGTAHGRPATITWRDGKLSGDTALAIEVLSRARVLEGQPVYGGLGCPTTTHDHLKTPGSAFALIAGIFNPAPSLISGTSPMMSEDME